MLSHFVPTKTEFLTKAWIFNVLNKSREEKQQSVLRSPEDIKTLNIKTLSSSTGRFSSSLIISVEFNCFTSMGEESLVQDFYVKMSASDVSIETKLLEREVRTHLELFPSIRRELNISTDDLMLLSVPEIILGAYQDSGEGILVAENLEKRNFKTLDLADDVSLSTLVRTVEVLARFHAATALLISKAGTSNVRRDFPHIRNVYNNDAIFGDTNRTLQEFSLLLKHIPGFYTQHLEFEEWRSSAWDVLSFSETSGDFISILHGNLSIDNVLDNGDQLLFTSWSHSRLGSPLLDLELLLLSSCSRKMREDNTQQLLETYYFSFCSYVKQLGSDPSVLAPALTVKFLREEFERYKFTAFLQAVVVLMTNMKSLEAKFNTSPENESAGRKLRVVGGRAVELVDEAVLNNWRRKCQVETSSLTIKLPSGRLL